MKFIKRLLGLGSGINYEEIKEDNNYVVIDVRTPQEFKSGHFKGSKNIPLNKISGTSAISKDKTIITCCASGMRSGQAASILRNKGYQRVHNGGSWQSVRANLN